MLSRRLRDLLKSAFFHLYKMGVRLGWYVMPAHYYTSEPNIVELERSMHLWAHASTMPGIEVDLDRQLCELRRVCGPFTHEYEGNRHYKAAIAQHFGPGFGYIEAQLLHAVVRSYKPEHIVEVGSGVSTRCTFAALELNAQETGTMGQITCIEPYPSAALRALAASAYSVMLVPQPVQAVPLERFGQLHAGDVLFIDSSHVVRAGGDVNHLVLEVLPRLAPGVLVHFHDIYFPYDYQRDVLQTFIHNSETSLLRAFLAFNSRFKILFSLSHLHYERPDELRELFPEYRRQSDYRGMRDKQFDPHQHFPSSTWLLTMPAP